MTHEALIARLENADTGSRELDAAIWLALGCTIKKVREIGGHTHERWIDDEGVRWIGGETNFTTSLDAARILIPRWGRYVVGNMEHRRPGTDAFAVVKIRPSEKFCRGRHQKSEPIALCIAALKAREASKP